jgi:hypothetical protein
MRRLQILCNRHPSFFIRQLVQLLQRILHISPSNKPLHIFSELHSVNCHILVYELLTRSALLNLFCRNPENRENLDGYLNHHIRHFRSWLYFCIDLETSKEHFNSLEDVQNGVLACPNVLSCLRDISRYNGPTRR